MPLWWSNKKEAKAYSLTRPLVFKSDGNKSNQKRLAAPISLKVAARRGSIKRYHLEIVVGIGTRTFFFPVSANGANDARWITALDVRRRAPIFACFSFFSVLFYYVQTGPIQTRAIRELVFSSFHKKNSLFFQVPKKRRDASFVPPLHPNKKFIKKKFSFS